MRGLFLAVCLLLPFLNAQLAAQAGQPYAFTVSTSPYVPLDSTATDLAYAYWDDPDLTVPLGFNFEFFNTTLDTMYVDSFFYGGTLSRYPGHVDPQQAFGPLLIGTMNDLADRQFFCGQHSPILYAVENTSAGRIVKLEYRNAGFYGEIFGAGSCVDTLNFQIWLYESTNVIQFRYGPGSVKSDTLSYQPLYQFFVGMVERYDFVQDTARNVWHLEGDPTNPSFVNYPDYNSGDLPNIPGLDSLPPNGTVYTFTPPQLSVCTCPPYEFYVYPNPATDEVYIHIYPETTAGIVELFDLQGRMLSEFALSGEKTSLSLEGLAPGVYLVKVRTQEATEVVKITVAR